MRRKRIVQAGKCYHLVSRVAHKAFFFDDEEKDRFVDLLMRVEFFCCVRVLAYCCMSNHIHSELAEKYPMLQKPKSPLQRYRLLRQGRWILS